MTKGWSTITLTTGTFKKLVAFQCTMQLRMNKELSLNDVVGILVEAYKKR